MKHLATAIQADINEQAEPEGWAIFTTDREPLFEIQRDDSRGIFTSDMSVWLHLWARSQRGDELAQRAFGFLMLFSPGEYKSILNHVEGS